MRLKRILLGIYLWLIQLQHRTLQSKPSLKRSVRILAKRFQTSTDKWDISTRKEAGLKRATLLLPFLMKLAGSVQTLFQTSML